MRLMSKLRRLSTRQQPQRGQRAKTSAKPGRYTGCISAKHIRLGLAQLTPQSGAFSILVPIHRFPKVLSNDRGFLVDFWVGEFGGVTDVRAPEKMPPARRASVSQAKGRIAAFS